MKTRQQGFGVIAALVVVVMLAVLAAAIVAIGIVQQTSLAQDVQSARAWQAARSGTEWGVYQALQAPTLSPAGTGIWALGAASDICPAGGALGHGTDGKTTLDLTAATGFYVTVTGQCWRYSEGLDSSPSVQQHLTLVYRIQATACPVSTGCPATAGAQVSSVGYVERSRVVVVTN
ncbi:MAG TPA: hypothetical protein VF816_05565 [Rhodocyclaceae bacterium]